jgi:hypothetical protein
VVGCVKICNCEAGFRIVQITLGFGVLKGMWCFKVFVLQEWVWRLELYIFGTTTCVCIYLLEVFRTP